MDFKNFLEAIATFSGVRPPIVKNDKNEDGCPYDETMLQKMRTWCFDFGKNLFKNQILEIIFQQKPQLRVIPNTDASIHSSYFYGRSGVAKYEWIVNSLTINKIEKYVKDNLIKTSIWRSLGINYQYSFSCINQLDFMEDLVKFLLQAIVLDSKDGAFWVYENFNSNEIKNKIIEVLNNVNIEIDELNINFDKKSVFGHGYYSGDNFVISGGINFTYSGVMHKYKSNDFGGRTIDEQKHYFYGIYSVLNDIADEFNHNYDELTDRELLQFSPKKITIETNIDENIFNSMPENLKKRLVTKRKFERFELIFRVVNIKNEKIHIIIDLIT